MNAKLSTMSTALEKAWKHIQALNTDVRDCIFTIYTAPVKRDGSYSRGYIFLDGWTHKDEGESKTDEVNINSYLCFEGGESIFRTLLHESVHSHNFENNIQDVSRQNRYHNKNFKIVAEKFGLVTGQVKGIGITTPDMTDATKKIYKKTIADLDETMIAYQNLYGTAGKKPTPKKPSGYIKLTCNCQRIIRASKQVYESGEITCKLCDSKFVSKENEVQI